MICIYGVWPTMLTISWQFSLCSIWERTTSQCMSNWTITSSVFSSSNTTQSQPLHVIVHVGTVSVNKCSTNYPWPHPPCWAFNVPKFAWKHIMLLVCLCCGMYLDHLKKDDVVLGKVLDCHQTMACLHYTSCRCLLFACISHMLSQLRGEEDFLLCLVLLSVCHVGLQGGWNVWVYWRLLP